MNTRALSLALLASSIVACSTLPERNPALDQASQRLRTTQGDPQVAALAPDELKRAADTLHSAEAAQASGAKTSRIDHLAYMASQQLTIAQDMAAGRAAQAVSNGAAAERDKTRLAQRTSEADAAQQKLALSEQSKASALAAADASAQRDQGRAEALEAQLRDLNAKKTDRGLVVTLGDVLFDTGRATLLPESSRNMSQLADVFKRDPERRASIEGYTDSTGGAQANQALSLRRADAVMNALLDLGVPPNRLSARGHGAEAPAASNASAAGRQMNRRVEIVFAEQATNGPVK